MNISVWLESFQHALDATFGDRVWFIGLQGSHARGEATENSDIDVVVILDELKMQDIRRYRSMLDGLEHRELICGFLSGKSELLNWEPSDLFQFYHDTIPIRGSLDDLLSLLDTTAVTRAVRIGACNVYHGCVHNMVHERDGDVLHSLYKAASFVVQAICFMQTGYYCRRQTELLTMAASEEQRIIETFLHLKQGGKADFDGMSEALFTWAKRWICADSQKT